MKIALVSDCGGHLTQMLHLLEAFRDHEFFFITYFSPRDEDLKNIAPVHLLKAGEMNLYIFVKAYFQAFNILLREKPDVLISTGAQIALPFFLWGKVMGKKLIFIESWSRVNKLSMTGQLLYPVVDEFFVQWPEMAEIAGSKAKYRGSVI